MTAPHLVPLAKLRESPSNPRKTFGDLNELAASMKRHGVLQPLLARKVGDELELIFGHRRYRAAKLAGLKEVPVILREMTDAETLEAQLVENVQREDIHEMEEAEAYEQLHAKFGYSVDQIAERVSTSRATVYARMKLLSLCDGARKVFFAGKFHPSTALLIARVKGERLQLRAVEDVSKLDDPMSARAAARVLKRYAGDEKSPGGARKPQTKAVAARLQERIHEAVLARACELLERKPGLDAPELRMMLLALGGDAQRRLSAAQLRAAVFGQAVGQWTREETNAKVLCKALGLRYSEIEYTVEQLEAKRGHEADAEALFRKAT
jgi:ParB/RepB/Spo0J family partition protein